MHVCSQLISVKKRQYLKEQLQLQTCQFKPGQSRGKHCAFEAADLVEFLRATGAFQMVQQQAKEMLQSDLFKTTTILQAMMRKINKQKRTNPSAANPAGNAAPLRLVMLLLPCTCRVT